MPEDEFGELNDKSLQLEFSKRSMLFLDKNKKWMPSNFRSSRSYALSLLHNIFVWSAILKNDNNQVQKPILFEKCWECPSSWVVLHQSTDGWSVYKLSSASISLVVLDSIYEPGFVKAF